MKKYLYFIGIDVSKLKLDVTICKENEFHQSHHFIVTNDKKGLKELLQYLKKSEIHATDVLFSFEDTGVYSMPLCCFLSDVGLDYWMIPAIEIKRSKGLVRGKSDKADSKDIAIYSHTHFYKLRLGKIPEKDLLKLRLLFTEREKLLKAIKVLDSTKEGIEYLPKEVYSEIERVNKSTINHLKKAIEKIEKRMQEIVKNNNELHHQNKLIQSIPGLGPMTSIYLILVTKGFTTFKNSRQLSCYAGVAPFEYSSGSSIKGRTKVSHFADKKLKSLLNMCAMNAKKCDPELKLYYERKLEEGKSKMLVLNNIRCKLLGRVFAVINRDSAYVNIQKFAA